MSRYEAPDEPSSDATADEWKKALQNAYTSATYLSHRHRNLVLLEEFGNNSWLISNSQVESVIWSLEEELRLLKAEMEEINRARKSVQEGSKGEIMALEESWKSSIGRTLEVQVATAGLRHEILKRRRATAR